MGPVRNLCGGNSSFVNCGSVFWFLDEFVIGGRICGNFGVGQFYNSMGEKSHSETMGGTIGNNTRRSLLNREAPKCATFRETHEKFTVAILRGTKCWLNGTGKNLPQEDELRFNSFGNRTTRM